MSAFENASRKTTRLSHPSAQRIAPGAARGVRLRTCGAAGLLALTAVAGYSGCASGTANLPQKPATPARPESPAFVATEDTSPAASRGQPATLPAPSGRLTLNQAIALASERSPELLAYAWDAQSALAEVRQARLWPNPEFEAERENFEGSGQFAGTANAETTLSLAQALPIGGDIKRRRQLAELQADLASWDYHAARLEILLETTQRFIAALAADRRLELAQQELELAQATERITSTRVEAGDASPVELSRVVVPVVTAELTVAQAERFRQAAYQRLALSWGSRDPSFESVSGELDQLRPPPSPQALTALVNESPAVARWATEVGLRIAEQRLARAEAIPDFTIRAGQKQDRASGDEALVVGISLPLPLFDRNQGELEAALLDERAARSRQRAAELRLEGLLSRAYADLASAYDEATALKERALPAAERAYAATRQAFQEGELPFLDVLDAQRTFFDLQGRYLAALADYHNTLAEVESLLGGQIPNLSENT